MLSLINFLYDIDISKKICRYMGLKVKDNKLYTKNNIPLILENKHLLYPSVESYFILIYNKKQYELFLPSCNKIHFQMYVDNFYNRYPRVAKITSKFCEKTKKYTAEINFIFNEHIKNKIYKLKKSRTNSQKAIVAIMLIYEKENF